MPRTSTFPTLYDEALQLNTSKLKEWGYLKPNKIHTGTFDWSIKGKPIGSISFLMNTTTSTPFVELDYKYRDEPRNYKVNLVSIPSNLGKGVIWYFICPQTNKRCRKLYSIGGYFLHREAFNGCMYESQTHSKTYRQVEKTFGAYFNSENLYSQLRQKHFKKTYAGKPTKKYLQIMKQIQKAESVSIEEIERVMIYGK